MTNKLLGLKSSNMFNKQISSSNSTYLNFKCSLLYFNSNSIILVLSALQVLGSSVVELLWPVTRFAGLIPVSWSYAKLVPAKNTCRTYTLLNIIQEKCVRLFFFGCWHICSKPVNQLKQYCNSFRFVMSKFWHNIVQMTSKICDVNIADISL